MKCDRSLAAETVSHAGSIFLGGECCLKSDSSAFLAPFSSLQIRDQRARRSRMAAVPSFPPEIVGLILESYRSDRSQDDLTFQWATLRQVCHHWKATMEKMFLTEHVPKTKLHCRMSKFFSLPHHFSHGLSLPGEEPNARKASSRVARCSSDGMRVKRLIRCNRGQTLSGIL